MTRQHALDEAPDYDAINLARALARLEPKIAADGAHRLRHSSIERAKTTANLEYARTLLLRREHATAQLKVQSRKKAAQATLTAQRARLAALTERLYELGHAEPEDGMEDGEFEEGEDILLQFVPPVEAVPEVPAVVDPAPASPVQSNEPDAPVEQAPSLPSPAATLRARNTAPSAREALLGSASAKASTTSYAAHPDAPPQSKPSDKNDISSTTATQLASADSEQSVLTDAMLSLAAALKSSAQGFAADLDADKTAVAQTEDALERNRSGMDVMTRSMGRLRRMSEGRWWVTRIGMMVLIPVLWVFMLVLVFLGPKIRF